jgi:uncharacterized protein (TIGR02444 family)
MRSDAASFKQFALELYGSDGVGAACLQLQARHGLDVNMVLFAAYVGAACRQALTTSGIAAARLRVDPWHQEVVRALRAVRQRLKTGPMPAPNDETERLRRKIQQIEIEAELIELDQLGALTPQLEAERASGSAADCATAAIETVVRAYANTSLDDADHRAINTIVAAAARQSSG